MGGRFNERLISIEHQVEKHMRWERTDILLGSGEVLRNTMVRRRTGRDGRVAR